MKGLILKSFYGFKDIFIIGIFFSIFYFIFYISLNSPIIDLLIAFSLSVILLLQYIKIEYFELSNFTKFTMVLPINKKAVIKSKYIANITQLSLIYLILFIVSFFIKEPENMKFIKYNLLYISFFSASVCIFSILSMLFYLFPKNLVYISIFSAISVLISVIIIMGVSLLSILFLSEYIPNEKILFLITNFFNIIVSFIIMFISYKVSCKKFEKLSL